MGVALKILIFGGLYAGCFVHADPNVRGLRSEKFFGFGIGMSSGEIHSILKQKGFPRVLDLDNVTPKPKFLEPGTCVTTAGPIREKSDRYSVMKCVGRGRIADPVNQITFELLNGRVYALSIAFEPRLSKQVVVDLLAKFGLPKTTEYLSGHYSKDIAEGAHCRKQTCYAAVWETSTSQTSVSYLGSSLESGYAVKLRGVDTVVLEKLKRTGVLESAERLATGLRVIDGGSLWISTDLPIKTDDQSKKK